MKFGTDYTRVREAYPEEHVIRDFFGAGSFSQRSLPNAQVLDCDGLAGRLRSSSYAPQEGHANYAPMMAALEESFRANQENGSVRMEYVTHVYFGRLR